MTKRIISIMTVFALTMSFTAFGMGSSPQEQTVEGRGYIASRDEATDVLVDVSVPGEFYWYADSSTKNSDGTYDIVCGDYFIINNSETLNLSVEIKGYKLSNPDSEENTILDHKINLNLTGQIAKDGFGQDLFANSGVTPEFGVCSEILASVNGDGNIGSMKWDIGFAGTYNDTMLPNDSQSSDYILILEFKAHGTSL